MSERSLTFGPWTVREWLRSPADARPWENVVAVVHPGEYVLKLFPACPEVPAADTGWGDYPGVASDAEDLLDRREVNAELVARYHNEVEALIRCRGVSGVVQIVDHGLLPPERWWEVDGRTYQAFVLREWVEGGRGEEPTTEEVGRLLARLHARNLWAIDLHKDNFIRRPDGEPVFVDLDHSFRPIAERSRLAGHRGEAWPAFLADIRGDVGRTQGEGGRKPPAELVREPGTPFRPGLWKLGPWTDGELAKIFVPSRLGGALAAPVATHVPEGALLPSAAVLSEADVMFAEPLFPAIQARLESAFEATRPGSPQTVQILGEAHCGNSAVGHRFCWWARERGALIIRLDARSSAAQGRAEGGGRIPRRLEPTCGEALERLVGAEATLGANDGDWVTQRAEWRLKKRPGFLGLPSAGWRAVVRSGAGRKKLYFEPESAKPGALRDLILAWKGTVVVWARTRRRAIDGLDAWLERLTEDIPRRGLSILVIRWGPGSDLGPVANFGARVEGLLHVSIERGEELAAACSNKPGLLKRILARWADDAPAWALSAGQWPTNPFQVLPIPHASRVDPGSGVEVLEYTPDQLGSLAMALGAASGFPAIPAGLASQARLGLEKLQALDGAARSYFIPATHQIDGRRYEQGRVEYQWAHLYYRAMAMGRRL